MRLFIDSSDPRLWENCRRLGWAYGATTNPLILKRDGRKCSIETYRDLVEAAKNTGLQELQIQATGSTVEELTRTGEEIAALWQHVVVKVPLTQAGLEAATNLVGQTTRITMTAAYATDQMIAAIAMGASYIAPYYGRLKEAGKDADAILQTMLAMRSGTDAPRILVASIRSIAQLEMLAASGHDTFTLSPEIAEQLAINPMSDDAAADFEKARLT